MPHLVIDRLRSVPNVLGQQQKGQNRSVGWSLFIQALDVSAGVLFILGSICFLPAYSWDLETFLLGCLVFVIGAALTALMSLLNLIEAIQEKGLENYESMENAHYLFGSFVFLAGTILYWPEEARHRHIEWMKTFSLGYYFGLWRAEFEGAILFIVGSVLFAMAAFVNGLNHNHPWDNASSKMMTASTSLYMVGGVLFAMGSVAFLPDLGCNHQMEMIGAVMFIVGSIVYTFGGLINVARTFREIDLGGAERDPEENTPLSAHRAP
eukprot:gnl/TRDRNA2_/TRDRNA2_153908_c0_seq1.p1 gnl/TRDRNA2_/TRDRNA2_153908_c0~~gnl/TRDRNA2_/TRDRNA2_153908_c0_seq1.p1  ORF type:complete len:266 (+),score=50.02 gnl/TRDRNA2_/TRDRNA2_153908_c0_seq1:137-934(+)